MDKTPAVNLLNFYVKGICNFFFLLVLCLPRHVCASNDAICHDVRLSLSCPMTSFSAVPPFFFPSILPSRIGPRIESPLIMWPSHFLCRIWIILLPFAISLHL